MHKYLVIQGNIDKFTALEAAREKPPWPYQVILDDCGATTLYSVLFNGIEHFSGVIKKQYNQMIKEFEGKYVEKVGYVMSPDIKEFERTIIQLLQLEE